jgi:hypothetical protein
METGAALLDCFLSLRGLGLGPVRECRCRISGDEIKVRLRVPARELGSDDELMRR